jgi:hypothetical protein
MRKSGAQKTREWRARIGPERYRAIQRAYRLRLRQEVIQAYGGACTCCGETTPEFLAVDHIYGDGKRERGNPGDFYPRLKREGFPKDKYRLLCHNCNMARGLYGRCPHEELEV